jgi:hypothetical protein
MSKTLDPKTMDVWVALRDALRRLRGMNLWRGNETMLLGLGQMRLHQESRDHRTGYKHFVIHLTPTLEALWAEEWPGGRKLSVAADFAGDWEAWLRAIVDDCRGAAYLHTASDRADYRHPQEEAKS